jgi:hypothetical protein
MEGCIGLVCSAKPDTTYFMKDGAIVAERDIAVVDGEKTETWRKGAMILRDNGDPAIIVYNADGSVKRRVRWCSGVADNKPGVTLPEVTLGPVLRKNAKFINIGTVAAPIFINMKTVVTITDIGQQYVLYAVNNERRVVEKGHNPAAYDLIKQFLANN